MTPNANEAAPRARGSVDAQEIDRFAAMADAWWDPNAAFRALHRFNAARLHFIRSRLVQHFNRDPAALQPFVGLHLLDVGCGGGLVAEPMSRLGFAVTAIDAGVATIAAARAHAEVMGLPIDYRISTIEALAARGPQFDSVLALELIEHLANPRVFYRSLGELVRPGGAAIVATLNRTLKSFALAVVGAEYLLRWLPRGTHDWRRFVRPSELASELHQHGLRMTELSGIGFDLRTANWSPCADLAVNYIGMAVRS